MLCAGMGDGEVVSRVRWGVNKGEKGLEAGGVWKHVSEYDEG